MAVPRDLSAMPMWESELDQEEGAQGVCGICPAPAQAPTTRPQPEVLSATGVTASASSPPNHIGLWRFSISPRGLSLHSKPR